MSKEEKDQLSTFELVEQYLSIYGSFLLTALGIIGNTLSIFIFVSPRYRRQSSHFYLLSLALSDLCFLMINLVEDTFRNHNAFYQSRLNILDRSSNILCIFVQYARNVTRSLSSWIVVSFTIERLIVIFHPLQRAVICRRKIARYVILVLILISLLNNINVPFQYGIITINYQSENETICDILPHQRSIYMKFAILTMLNVYLIPMCIIIIVNTLICMKLWRKNVLIKDDRSTCSIQKRESLSPPNAAGQYSDRCSCLARKRKSSSISINVKPICKTKRTSSLSQYQSMGPLFIQDAQNLTVFNDENSLQIGSQSISLERRKCSLRPKGSTCSVKSYIQSRTHRVTLTLLLVSCSFLLLNSPYCAVWIANYIHRFRISKLKSLKEICELFMLTNFCINFLLYCVSGKAFRSELICLIRCQWKYLLGNDDERRMLGLSRSRADFQMKSSKMRTMSPSLQRGESVRQQNRPSLTSFHNKINL